MIYHYKNPVGIHFGPKSVCELGSILGTRKAVLVTFPEARELGFVERFEKLLGCALLDVMDQVQPNPDVQELSPMYERFWRDHAACDVIIALGGGSAIDTSKALMTGTSNGRFDELKRALTSKKTFTPSRVKSLIAIPTTAGTGSEVTPWATLWDREADQKLSLHLPQTWAEAAIVDPELMLTLPRATTLQTGLDALSHSLEAIWNINANPVSDMFAISAARGILATLPSLIESLQNIELRTRMALASLKAGLAFSNTKTALAHSISYEITLHHGIPHGIACSFSLPMILERILGLNAERDAIFSKIFGDRLNDAPGHLRHFMNQLGVSTEFSAYGVSDTEFQAIIKKAMDGPRGKNFIGKEAWIRP